MIELLVVIAIIAILSSLLFSSLNSARMKAQQVICANHLRQLALASHIYAVDNNEFVPRNQADPQAATEERWPSWVAGSISYETQITGFSLSETTNVNLLLEPKFGRIGNYTRTHLTGS